MEVRGVYGVGRCVRYDVVVCDYVFVLSDLGG